MFTHTYIYTSLALHPLRAGGEARRRWQRSEESLLHGLGEVGERAGRVVHEDGVGLGLGADLLPERYDVI